VGGTWMWMEYWQKVNESGATCKLAREWYKTLMIDGNGNTNGHTPNFWLLRHWHQKPNLYYFQKPRHHNGITNPFRGASPISSFLSIILNPSHPYLSSGGHKFHPLRASIPVKETHSRANQSHHVYLINIWTLFLIHLNANKPTVQ